MRAFCRLLALSSLAVVISGAAVPASPSPAATAADTTVAARIAPPAERGQLNDNRKPPPSPAEALGTLDAVRTLRPNTKHPDHTLVANALRSAGAKLKSGPGINEAPGVLGGGAGVKGTKVLVNGKEVRSGSGRKVFSGRGKGVVRSVSERQADVDDGFESDVEVDEGEESGVEADDTDSVGVDALEVVDDAVEAVEDDADGEAGVEDDGIDAPESVVDADVEGEVPSLEGAEDEVSVLGGEPTDGAVTTDAGDDDVDDSSSEDDTSDEDSSDEESSDEDDSSDDEGEDEEYTFRQVFEGTGTNPDDRDASIQGTAYLTYTLVNNATYNVEECLEFCRGVQGCVFANLYYELNNHGLDFNPHLPPHLSSPSNLKCAVYGDVHTAEEKTNWGGQQSYPYPAPLVVIQESSGWVKVKGGDGGGDGGDGGEGGDGGNGGDGGDGGDGDGCDEPDIDPVTPEGYELTFGPVEAANDADGYIGFSLLDKYDVEACAERCNRHDPNGPGGACQFFNIWRALIDGVPAGYTCELYTLPTDESTATYTGHTDGISITHSRGYTRTNYITDGSFQSFTCPSSFCFQESYEHWIGTSSNGGYMDATIFYYAPYARSGSTVGLLGSATGADGNYGTLSYAHPVRTKPGGKYLIALWVDTTFGGEQYAEKAYLEVLWNDKVVKRVEPGYVKWGYVWVEVEALGFGVKGPGDRLQLRGGRAPSWVFVDDVAVWYVG